jgi:2-amino-4-hydroxy-6-hydroxymethyldihydropteridine diphosphokinase
METVFLSIGSNLGDRFLRLSECATRLSQLLENIRTSSIWETAPMYTLKQPYFLNAVVAGRTDIEPVQLLECLHQIEHSMGRIRETETNKGPRPIDIDLVLYGDRIIDSAELVLPHPGLYERRFVLVPLLEIEPDLIEPRSGTPLRTILERLSREGVYSWASGRYNFP